MGRARSDESSTLPKHMHKKGSSYYAVSSKGPRRIWVPLGNNFDIAVEKLNSVIQTDSRFAGFDMSTNSNGFVMYEGYPVHIACADLQDELKRIYKSTAARAKSAKREFELSYDEFIDLYKRSKGYCELTGIPFKFKQENKSWASNPWVPSLDRINSKAGYNVNNCRFLCNAVNRSLGEWGDLVFSKMATAYASRSTL